MYKLEYLPVAQKDLVEIVEYISKELNNPDAAERLSEKIIGAAENICSFPYAYPAYVPIRPLKHEYRKLVVRNYLMFYWIDNASQVVTIARVIHAKRNYSQMLLDVK